MADEINVTSEESKPTTPSRRRFITGAAAATGAAVASTYVRPDLKSFGVPSALAQSGGIQGPCNFTTVLTANINRLQVLCLNPSTSGNDTIVGEILINNTSTFPFS